MAVAQLYAGPAIRRLRRGAELTQAAMAAALDISPSYLNLIEHGQRPLSARLIVLLAERFGFDPASLTEAASGGGVAALRRRLADPLFADLDVDAREVEEWLASSPALAAAFARLYDAAPREASVEADAEPLSLRLVRHEIQRWSNHFADLDAQAEALADELRLVDTDLYAALGERLRSRHQLAIRILPLDVMPDRLRRLDLHARQVQLSELLGPASRTFQAAVVLMQIEARATIDALVAGAALADRGATRLFRRHLAHYAAAALMMPYGRFARACEASGYDLPLLERRFGVGFEQVAHRLTTMQRVGARGLPCFMLRIDAAGQLSKRYAGASGSPLVDGAHICPLWQVTAAFARPGSIVHDHIMLEDGSVWLTLARSVDAPARDPQTGRSAQFVIVVGVERRLAGPLTIDRAFPGEPTPVGLGCARCLRPDCVQRARPPEGRAITLHERERGVTPFDFAAR